MQLQIALLACVSPQLPQLKTFLQVESISLESDQRRNTVPTYAFLTLKDFQSVGTCNMQI